jgi:O-antigen/teichoic acid export membrane protein
MASADYSDESDQSLANAAASAARPIAGAAPNEHSPNEHASTRADSVFTSLAWVLMLAIVQRGLGFVREVLFCRWLDQDELGEWAIAFVFLMTSAAFVTFGIQGSMNRYVEFYRQRGQLRAYLRRVALASGLSATVAATALWHWRTEFSSVIFGRPDRVELVALLATTLAVVVANNFFLDFFTSLRIFRIVSAIQFFNGVLFVAFGLGSMLLWRVDAMGVLAGFTIAYASVALVAAGRAWHVGRSLPIDRGTLAGRSFWSQAARAGVALWGYNCLVNLFEVADRYMLVHLSPLDAAGALATVGDYHSARVVPSLLITAAALVGTTLMPHWSHAWEAGRRQQLARTQKLVLKLIAIGLCFIATAVLIAAPLLFDVAFAGKFRAGREILPWVLATAVWTGLAGIAFNYLWCAERLGLCALSLALGVSVNIALNFWWIPAFGLLGAVLATCVAQFLQLAVVYRLSRAFGMPLDGGLWLLTAAPVLLGTGVWGGVAISALMVAGTVFGTVLFTGTEKTRIRAAVDRFFGRFFPQWTSLRRNNAANPSL